MVEKNSSTNINRLTCTAALGCGIRTCDGSSLCRMEEVITLTFSDLSLCWTCVQSPRSRSFSSSLSLSLYLFLIPFRETFRLFRAIFEFSRKLARLRERLEIIFAKRYMLVPTQDIWKTEHPSKCPIIQNKIYFSEISGRQRPLHYLTLSRLLIHRILAQAKPTKTLESFKVEYNEYIQRLQGVQSVVKRKRNPLLRRRYQN